jgi:hypothetical protein
MYRIVTLALIVAFALPLMRCGKSSHEHHDHAVSTADSIGQAMLKQVDQVHNEAMEKMGEVRKLREDLKKQLESGLAAEQKKLIESKIAALDSAYDGMMDWMHKFHPEVDTLAEEAYQQYLKVELDKATQVKQDILDAIARAKE